MLKKQIGGIGRYLFLSTVFCIALTSQATAGWQLEWIDNFDGTRVNKNNWTSQDQANYNNEVQCYTDDDTSAEKNYDVSNGTLKIISRRKNNNCAGLNGDFKSWTSGRLNSKDKKEFLYGRIEARLRFNTLKQGTWPAFWMLENRIREQPIKGDGDSVNWPNPGAGEIDVWEWHGNQPTTYITNFFNTGGCGGLRLYNYPNGSSDVLQWHTYAIEWDRNEIEFFVDDLLVASHNVTNCPQYKEPMFVLLNVAMGGTLGGSIDSTLNSATLEVDYVAHCSESNANSLTRCVQSLDSGSDVVVADDITIFENAEIQSWAAWDCCGGSNPVLVTDDATQQEVMEFRINGQTVVGFISRSPFAASPESFNASTFMANGTLEFDLKMTAPPRAGVRSNWKLKLESNNAASEAQIELSSNIEGHTVPVLNTWQHYSFKLSDLASAGLSLDKIDLIMVFPEWGTGDGAVFRIDNVKMLSNTTPSTPNQATTPVITSTPVTTVLIENAYSYQFEATGDAGLVYTAPVLPSWLTLTATGHLTGTPSVADAGENEVVLAVSNSDGSESIRQLFTISVTGLEPAPAITSSAVTSVTSGGAYSYQIQAGGVSGLSYAASVMPNWLTLNTTTGYLSGTPSASDAGSHQVSILVSRVGAETTTHSFNITVAASTGTNAGTGTSSNSGGGKMDWFLMMLFGGLLLARSSVFRKSN